VDEITCIPERLRQRSFDDSRLRARLRILSYHWSHAERIISPQPDIERYERSFLYRCWIDLWFFCSSPARTQLPLNWVARTAWSRRARAVLGRAARLAMRR
jgi:hypothetical protein